MRAFVLTCLAVLLFVNVYAETSKKEFQKSFDKKGIDEVVISNKYGQIEIEQTDGDKIDISVVMAVTAKSGVKADETLELIDVKDTQSGHYVSVETVFQKDMTFKQLLSGVELNISYKVSIPKDIKLRLINTEGNIYAGDYVGNMTVDIQTGNFKAGSLKEGELYIKQSKGNFDVADVALMDGEFKACTLKIEEGGEVKLVANDCEGRLMSIEKLTIRSSGGDLKLGQIEDMSGSASSTKYEIQDIGNSLLMDMKFGEINVRNIHFNFSTVDLRGSYTKVGLTFMEGAGYNLEFKHNKSLKIDMPRTIKLDQQPTSDKNMVVEVGFVGDKKYNGKVLLNLKNGNIFIQ